MAFSRIEPFGSGVDDLRTGSVVSMLANINRNSKVVPEPFGVLDFIPWSDGSKATEKAEPILLDDPKAQSALIASMMFPKRD